MNHDTGGELSFHSTHKKEVGCQTCLVLGLCASVCLRAGISSPICKRNLKRYLSFCRGWTEGVGDPVFLSHALSRESWKQRGGLSPAQWLEFRLKPADVSGVVQPLLGLVCSLSRFSFVSIFMSLFFSSLCAAFNPVLAFDMWAEMASICRVEVRSKSW